MSGAAGRPTGGTVPGSGEEFGARPPGPAARPQGSTARPQGSTARPQGSTARPQGSTARPLAWGDVAALLRQRHLRLTPQRRAVVAALAEFEGHVTAAQLVERCVERDAEFVPSTVYRTLDVLEELGLITHIHDADGHEAFQPAAEAPHAHLICRACGSAREIPGDDLGDFVGLLHRKHGFDVDLSHLAIFGRCTDCAD